MHPKDDIMEYKNRQYPLFSACGLNCGLCPRYHTEGKSKCTGCAGSGFSSVHPSCSVLSCCQRKEIEYCFLCDEFPCKKYEGADLKDSFITHKNQLKDSEKARNAGIDEYKTELNEKVRMLTKLLELYDDGRRKSFYCLAINLLDLQDIRFVIEQIEAEVKSEDSINAKAKLSAELFTKAAENKSVSLKLRKKAN
jgi:hypothetical protein